MLVHGIVISSKLIFVDVPDKTAFLSCSIQQESSYSGMLKSKSCDGQWTKLFGFVQSKSTISKKMAYLMQYADVTVTPSRVLILRDLDAVDVHVFVVGTTG